MPSDPSLSLALAAVRKPFEAFRSAVAQAAQEVRGLLDRDVSARVPEAALGLFAQGRIDPARFVGLVDRTRSFDAASISTLEACAHVLEGVAAASPESLVVASVPRGGSLLDTATSLLSDLGRCFSAARAAGLARDGASRGGAAPEIAPLPPGLWTHRERRVAPPIVLDVEGADLRTAALAELLDGAQKVFLVVRGPAAPAPLARLVTPGTFVVQTGDAAGLEAAAAYAGPAVAAILPDGAWFSHDPAAGSSPWDRIEVRRLPEKAPRASVGGLSPWQQAEDLRHLAALASRPPAAVSVPVGGADRASAPVDPAERLASWLVSAVDWREIG